MREKYQINTEENKQLLKEVGEQQKACGEKDDETVCLF